MSGRRVAGGRGRTSLEEFVRVACSTDPLDPVIRPRRLALAPRAAMVFGALLLVLGLGLAVSVLASLLNGAVAWMLYRAGRRERSVTLVADAKHLATDVVTSAAVLVGVALVAVFDSAVLDAVVALGAGLNIMWTGFTLIRDSVGGLMDIAPSAEVLQTVERVLARHRRAGMIDFHAVRVREAGNRRFMELHVLVPAAWSVKKGHDFTEQVIDELVDADASLRISAHLEPIEDPKSYEDLEDI